MMTEVQTLRCVRCSAAMCISANGNVINTVAASSSGPVQLSSTICSGCANVRLQAAGRHST